ncbi:acyl-CoA dehydrogenase family protein [Mycobacterium asiaticum]|uniref:Acyl-CoA dehydrogenase n=1 Tax=Mycobacterium asiaticum TaxID=1790 RepID=A0A1A3N9U1_MYCAS|nr:acyl-CoA dehydrogenase family protein [Mycobacterium asiaticum]OBK18115.1 acyl-CoA dehydrogenase [Mycobacterium asiaticum]
MDLSLSDEQRQLVESFAALFARESTAARVRAAEPLGFDPDLWNALVDTGAVEMAVAEADGGAGASVLDLTLIAEQFGRAVASAPLIEAQVAARLLGDCGGVGNELLGPVLAGDRLVTFAPHAGRHRCLRLVPAGAVADWVIAMVDGQLLAVPLRDNRTPIENLGSLPLADIAIDGDYVLLAEGASASDLFGTALDLWLTLTAAALTGAAARAVEFAVDYAKQRQAFGAAIGSFQAVSHPLADSATAAAGSRLLALRAACADTDEPDRMCQLAAMAFAFAYETARDATRRSLHIHGGYGFSMECDVQLYYRRVRGWALVYGESAVALDRVADARYGKGVHGRRTS